MSAPDLARTTPAAPQGATPGLQGAGAAQDSQDNLPDNLQGSPQDSLQARGPWEQLPGEPPRWFGRFQMFLRLGPTRTLRETCCVAGLTARRRPYTCSSDWSAAARRWRWRERALAWDARQRELLALSERNARIGLRERRVGMIDDYLEAVRAVLDNANLPDADQELARQWLPLMRVFLRDLLAAQRVEYEREDYAKGDPDNTLPITADDLRAAQRALDAEEAARSSAPWAAEAVTPREGPAGRGQPGGPQERTLFVCAGAESAFMLDLAALRAVRSATGLQFKRLLDATRAKFEQHLRRERSLGRPVELLHLALHTGPDGVQFTDGPADGNWLSERLFGVRVMLIAGCESDGVGDWLGVIPHVVTLGEEISGADAGLLTQHFWRNIGLGLEPGAALDEALTHCPPVVGEYVVRHW